MPTRAATPESDRQLRCVRTRESLSGYRVVLGVSVPVTSAKIAWFVMDL